MMFAVLPYSLAFLSVFVLNGWRNGWGCAYDLMLAITSPWDTAKVHVPWLAFPLSFAGWLLAPALVGGVIGYAVNRGLTHHRTATVDEVKALLVSQAVRPVAQEVSGRESDHSTPS